MRCRCWATRCTCLRSVPTARKLACAWLTNAIHRLRRVWQPVLRNLRIFLPGLVEACLRFLNHRLDLREIVERHGLRRPIADAGRQDHGGAATRLTKHADLQIAQCPVSCFKTWRTCRCFIDAHHRSEEHTSELQSHSFTSYAV